MSTCFKCKKNCTYVDVTKDKNIKDLYGGPCDFCKNMVCRDCSKLTSSDIRALMTQTRIVLFFCEDYLCHIKQLGTVKKNSEDLQHKYASLEKDIKVIQQDMANLGSKVDEAPKSYSQTLLSTTNTINKEISDIKKSTEFISQCFEDQKKDLRAFTDLLKTYSKENSALKQEIKALENKIGHSEQKEKENNVIISGLEFQNSADVPDIVKAVFKRMNLESLSIKQCNALIEKENSPILVKLSTRKEKTLLFKKRKDIGKITAESCGLQGRVIYLNEDLTVENQKLFKYARDARRQKKIEVAYTYNGSVYIKKSSSSEAIKILHEDSLKDL